MRHDFFLTNYHRFENYKASVIFRHPIDVAISSARYHKTCQSEAWLLSNRKMFGVDANGNANNTYQRFVQSLSDDDAVLFEMTCGAASVTINNMLLMSQLVHNPRNRLGSMFKVVLAEDFKHDFNRSMEEIADYLQVDASEFVASSQNLSYEAFATLDTKKSSIKNITYAITMAREHRYEFDTVFSCLGYHTFETIFGLQTLHSLGYSDSLDMFALGKLISCANVTTDDVYVSRSCNCSHGGLPYGYVGCALTCDVNLQKSLAQDRNGDVIYCLLPPLRPA